MSNTSLIEKSVQEFALSVTRYQLTPSAVYLQLANKASKYSFALLWGKMLTSCASVKSETLEQFRQYSEHLLQVAALYPHRAEIYQGSISGIARRKGLVEKLLRGESILEDIERACASSSRNQ